MTGRLVLVPTSPRVAPGLLTASAWDLLRSGVTVLAAAGHPLLPYLEAEGVQTRLLGADGDPERQAEDVSAPGPAAGANIVTVAPVAGAAALAAERLLSLAEEAGRAGVVWLVGTDGDPDLGRALGAAVESGRSRVELEVLPGSYDLAGARLLDLVAVMDRLRSPDGCPWDAEQTHESLASYLLEETYETLEAIDTADPGALREELGDLLLQVVFHARIAEEDEAAPWSVDDVAEGIVTKLVSRHPHVFARDAGAAALETAADVEAGWERAKAREKSRRSAVDGVPMALPALSLAAKLVHRAEKHGVGADVVPPVVGEDLGARLMALVVEARTHGVDAETELRRAAHDFARRVRSAERG